MNSSKDTLFHIFELQNQVIERYIKDHQETYFFICKCFDFLDIKLPSTEWLTIPEDHRKLFNYYHADVVSTLINVTRLALQGCETDSYALLRVANQELGEFNSVIELSLYEQVYAELRNYHKKGKRFSGHLQKKIDQIKDSKREYIYGRLSNIGSHSSPARLASSIQRDEIRQKMKIGLMINNPYVEASLFHISAHLLYALRVFDDFFIKNLSPNSQSPLIAGREIAEAEYQIMMNMHAAKVGNGQA